MKLLFLHGALVPAKAAQEIIEHFGIDSVPNS
jgi:hypothetical protein